MISAIRSSLFLLVLLLVVACNEKPFFDSYHHLNKGWHKDSIVHFDVSISDTSAHYGINVKLRHNAEYPYSNLWVFRRIASNLGTEYQDSANFILADPSGKWLGQGVGELKTVVRKYREEALRFRAPGIYTFYLQQGMRMDDLPGIEAVGLEVYKLEEE